MTKKKGYKRYSPEFKREALKRVFRISMNTYRPVCDWSTKVIGCIEQPDAEMCLLTTFESLYQPPKLPIFYGKASQHLIGRIPAILA